MDVYSQSEDRAHGSGFVGIGAESDDAVETFEVYGALLNPREADSSSAQAPGGMPMMGMRGAGSAAGAEPSMHPAPPPGLVPVDPAQVEAVASQWSELSRRMASVKGVVSGLTASMSDFGQVRHPAAPYAQMTLGIKTMTGVASEQFELIADGLAYGARSYREQEAAAAKTLGRTQ